MDSSGKYGRGTQQPPPSHRRLEPIDESYWTRSTPVGPTSSVSYGSRLTAAAATLKQTIDAAAAAPAAAAADTTDDDDDDDCLAVLA